MIDYAVTRSARRKTASIMIHPDNRVEVRVPLAMPEAVIARFVADKRDWINRKRHFNSHIRTPFQPKRFTEGERFSLLGKPYTLFIRQGSPAIKTDGEQLILSTCDPAPEHCREQIINWLQQQALAHLKTRCEHFATALGLHPASIGIKSYKSRWGSCHHDGRIYFNWRLVMAPEWVIDHIVAHELCHLRHPNHSRDFHALLASISPVQRETRSWLKTHGLSLDI